MHFPATLLLKASLRLKSLLIALHLMLAVAFAVSMLPMPIIIAVWLMLGYSLFSVLRSESRKTGVRLTVDEGGIIGFVNEQGVLGTAVPSGCVDWGCVVWLQWRQMQYRADTLSHAPRTLSLMLLPDHVDQEGWRMLRIWLRHMARPRADGATAP